MSEARGAGASDVESRTLARVRRRLVAFSFVCYVVAYLDRINIGFVSGVLQRELGLSHAAYGFGAGLFFLGYFLFEVPSNLILEKVGARLWIARIMIVWGLVSMATVLVRGEQGFYAMRVALGLAEAGFFPGIVLYLTYWIPARERARSGALFMTAAPVAVLIGAPVSEALLRLHGWLGLEGWQWLFLVEGLPAVLLGLVALVVLTDRPAEAAWLDPEGRAWLVAEMSREQEARERRGASWRSLFDPKLLLVCLIYFLNTTVTYGLFLWLPQMVEEAFGGPKFVAVMIPFAFALVAMVLVGRHSDRSGERKWHVAGSALVAAVGLGFAAAFRSDPWLLVASVTLSQMGQRSVQPTFWAIPPLFLGGTAAAAGIALVNSIGNLGGYAGPWAMGALRDLTQSHTGGLLMLAGALVLQAALVASLRLPPREPPPESAGAAPRRIARMKIRGLLEHATLVLPLLAAASLAQAQAARPNELPRSDPEAQGLPSKAIQAFVEAAEAKIDAVHSVMVVRHGRVVAEGWWAPYGKNDPHVMYSLSKSFTSTAVGMAVAEGKLKLDDGVLAAFPEDAPATASDNLKAMRLRDLLRMNTGQHADDVSAFRFDSDDKLTRVFLSLPVVHKPGTHFWYNTPATYMASAMVQKATGQTVLDYLRPRLFEPLGIESPTWDASKQGITLGGFGLRIRTEDIARFGQLYLQKGEWQGKQLLPAEWIAEATARQTSNGSSPTSDWEQGYGYQFWRCRHGLYRGDGAFGQFCIVMEKQDAVVAITSGTQDLAGVMNLVWEHILPALRSEPLPADTAGVATLRQKLAGLTLPPQAGEPAKPLAAQVSGKRYVFPANDAKLESVVVEFGAKGAVIRLRQDGKDTRIPAGRTWQRGDTLLTLGQPEKVAGTGAWTADDTFTAKLAAYETPFVQTVAFQWKGEELRVDTAYNVAFGEKKRPQLVGRLEKK